MKRLAAWSLFAFASLSSATAMALPPLPDLLKETFKDEKAFLEKFNELKGKCDVCHKPGADKKAKDHGLNDYGEALHQSINFKEFKAAMTAKDKEAMLKLFKEGAEKAAKEKNADGKTYGELIKAGALPGKNS